MNSSGEMVVCIGHCSACGVRRYRLVDDLSGGWGDICNFCRREMGEPVIEGELRSSTFAARAKMIKCAECAICGRDLYKPEGRRGRNPKRCPECKKGALRK